MRKRPPFQWAESLSQIFPYDESLRVILSRGLNKMEKDAFNGTFESNSFPALWPHCGSIAEIQTSLGVGLAAIGRISAASVDRNTGVVSVTIAKILGVVEGSTITLTPSINASDSSISWKWGGTIPPQYLPKG